MITTNDVAMTYELHVIRAHLLHYTSLLRDFRTSVEFVRDTANPAMDADDVGEATRAADKELLDKECGHLLSEINRLELNRKMQDDRVQNAQNLVSPSCPRHVPDAAPANPSWLWLGVYERQYRGQQGDEASLVRHHDLPARVFRRREFCLPPSAWRTVALIDPPYTLAERVRDERGRDQSVRGHDPGPVFRSESAAHLLHHLDHRRVPEPVRPAAAAGRSRGGVEEAAVADGVL